MLVLFDCDGVLVDSEIISSRVDSERLAAIGYDISVQEMSQIGRASCRERVL